MVKIDVNNRQSYEYPKVELSGLSSKYIYIPLSVITDSNSDNKRVGVFSYFRIHCGLNDTIGFTIPDLVEWCGAKVNRRQSGSNEKFLNVVDDLSDKGYLTYLTDKSKSSFMKCVFNKEYYKDEYKKGYAVVYLDEIEKIINYKKDNKNDGTITSVILLLVFSYLRYKIVRRPNELSPEERNADGIQERKYRLPEAYNDNIATMAEEIGIHKQTFSKAIDILEEELELIVTDRGYRVRNRDGEFRTPPTIFANAYKREGNYLLVTEENYSRNEIESKVLKIKDYYKGFKINEELRK